MIDRLLESKMLENIRSQKVTILLGARRVGKTSLLKRYLLHMAMKSFGLMPKITTQKKYWKTEL